MRQSKRGRHPGDDFLFDFDVFMGHADLSSFVERYSTNCAQKSLVHRHEQHISFDRSARIIRTS